MTNVNDGTKCVNDSTKDVKDTEEVNAGTKDVNDSVINLVLTWFSPTGVKEDFASQNGALSEIGPFVDKWVPAKHELDAEQLRELILADRDVAPNLEFLRQSAVIETPAGYVVATWGDLSGRRRARRPRMVHVRWKISNVESGGYFLPFQRGLAWRIARRTGIGIRNAAYVRKYLDLVIKADPGADLHKVLLQPPDNGTDERGWVRIVEDRRLRVL